MMPHYTEPICDFCSAPLGSGGRIFKSRPVSVAVGIFHRAIRLDPDWMACPDCERFVVLGDAEGLFQHAMTGYEAKRLAGDPTIARLTHADIQMVVRTAHSGFWAAKLSSQN